MNIYKFPIDWTIKYNFITSITMKNEFMKNELFELSNNNKLNLEYWNLIYWKQSNPVDKQEAEEEIIELLTSISDEDIDERLEEYKWKKDLNKIVNIIQYLKDTEIKELIYIIDCILYNNYLKKDLVIFDKDINKNIKYILKEYTILTESIQSDIDLKESLLVSSSKKMNKKKIELIRSLFIAHFLDLEMQINWFNDQKDDILKNVYLAQKWDKKAKEYIIGTVIYEEASKIAKRFAYKSNTKNNEEKRQLYNDLFQEAILSSMTGLNKFDVSKNDNFIFYIRYWMKQWIHKWLENQYNEIKIPSYIIQLFSKIKNLANKWESIEDSEIDLIVNELLKENNEKNNKKIKEIEKQIKNTSGRDAEKLKDEIILLKEMQKDPNYRTNLSKKVKNTIEKINSNAVYSIWNMLKNLEDDETWGMEANILIDESADIEQAYKNNERAEEMRTLVEKTLTKEEFTVIKHRFWLFGADILLLETLWKKINKSAERVRQVLKNAQEKLAIKKFDQVASSLNREKKLLQNKVTSK